jgi:hypothetical protein
MIYLVVRKYWFMFLLPICVLMCLCYFFTGDDGDDILNVYLIKIDPSYISEVHRFIDVATNHAWRTKTKHICYPCMDYKNAVVFDDRGQINIYIYIDCVCIFIVCFKILKKARKLALATK